MATYDSIINVDEWISDHYFTTDEGESFTKRVKNRTKEWAQLEQESNAPSPVKRLQAERGELLGDPLGCRPAAGRATPASLRRGQGW